MFSVIYSLKKKLKLVWDMLNFILQRLLYVKSEDSVPVARGP